MKKGFEPGRDSDEVGTAEWLMQNFGGDIVLLRELGDEEALKIR